MQRYFFHIEDHERFLDDEGTLLRDVAAARVEAVRVAGAMLKDHADQFWALGEWRVVVTDAHRRTLFGLSFQAIDPAALPATYDITPGLRLVEPDGTPS
jgi:hypothetical protein